MIKIKAPSPKKPEKMPLGCVIFLIILAVFIVWCFLAPTFRINGWVKKARASAPQSLLRQLTLAEIAHSADHEVYAASWEALMEYGFRPDPAVRLKLVVLDYNCGGTTVNGIWALASHQAGKKAYLYENISDLGVREQVKAKPLGDEYSFQLGEFKSSAENSFTQRELISGPPILFIWARMPLGLPASYKNE